MSEKDTKQRGLSGWCLPGPAQHAGSGKKPECPGEFPSVICSCDCHGVQLADDEPKELNE